jgi:hypothetical protein
MSYFQNLNFSKENEDYQTFLHDIKHNYIMSLWQERINNLTFKNIN